MGEPFQATTTKNQSKRAVRYHRLALLKVALRCAVKEKCKNRAPDAVRADLEKLCPAHLQAG